MGHRTGKSQGAKLRPGILGDRSLPPECMKFYQRYWSPNEVGQKVTVMANWGSSATPMLVAKGRKKSCLNVEGFVDRLQFKGGMKNLTSCYFCLFLHNFPHVNVSQEGVYYFFFFSTLHLRENKVANKTHRSYTRDVHRFSSSTQ